MKPEPSKDELCQGFSIKALQDY